MTRLLTSLILLLPFIAHAAGPTGGAIQGTLLAPGGAPVTLPSVSFKVQVWDKTATCMLYEETHAGLDLSATNGDFSFDLGFGSGRLNNVDGSAALKQNVFRNDVNIAPAPLWCPGGLTFVAGDARMIRVQYDVGGGFVAMTPDMRMQGSIYSVVAETLQGKAPSDFVTIRDDVSHDLSQANIENIFSSANYTKLNALINGTASYSMNNQRITDLAAPTLATDAATKGYADTYVGGKTIDASTVGPATGNGHTLIWDQAANQWITAIPSDSTKLPLAGGAMTGPIAMGAQNITNIGHMTMASQRTIHLGTFTTVQETTLIATPLALAQEGVSWYNSDENVFKIWDGTRAVAMATTNAGGDLDSAMIPADVLLDGGNTRGAAINIGANDAFGVNIETANAPRLTVDSTGQVGIGTTDPTATLHVNGLSGSTHNILNLHNQSGAAGSGLTIQFRNSTVPGAYITEGIESAGNMYLSFSTRGSNVIDERVRINSLGNVGIGTTTPNAPLNIASTGNAFIRLDSGGTGVGSIDSFGGNNALYLRANGSGIYIQNGGNVGIGTTAPTAGARFDVSGVTPADSTIIVPRADTANRPAVGIDGMMRYNTSLSRFEFYQGGSWVSYGTGTGNGDFLANGTIPMTGAFQAVAGDATTPGITFTGDANNGLFAPAADTVAITTAGSERLRVTASGRVGIGTTTPGAALQVANGSVGLLVGADSGATTITDSTTKVARQGIPHYLNAEQPVAIYHANAGVTENYLTVGGGTNAMNAMNTLRFFTAGNNTTLSGGERMRIDSDGNVAIGTTTPTAGTLLDISGTGAAKSSIIIPRDTTLNRPAAGVNGMMRYNTTSNKFEFYENGAWTNYGTGSGAGDFLANGSVDMTGTLKAVAGTAAAPGYTFVGDTDTGTFKMAGDGWWGLSSNNKEIMWLSDATIFNRVSTWIDYETASAYSPSGAGTSPAASTLLVGNNHQADTAASMTIYRATNTADTDQNAYIGVSSSPAGHTPTIFIGQQTGANSYEERVRIDTAGKMGIGTTAPTLGARLDVAGATAADSSIIIPRASTANRPAAGVNGMIRYNTSDDKFEFYEDGGWTNYATGSGGAGDFLAAGTVNMTGTFKAVDGTTALPGITFASDTSNGIALPAADTMTFSTAGAERLRVAAGGNVGIGTTNPNTALEVSGALRLSGAAVDTYTTPGATNVPTKINIPHYDPGAFGQVVAMGLPSTAQTTSRAISLFDARTVAHQPTLSVFSPDESAVVGFSFDGSNTAAYTKSTVDLVLNAHGSDRINMTSTDTHISGAVASNVYLGDTVIGAATDHGAIFNVNTSSRASETVGIAVRGSLGADGRSSVHIDTDETSNGRFPLRVTANNSAYEIIAVTAAGRVGIGTTAPNTGTILDVNGTGTGGSSILIPRDTTGNRPTAGVNGMLRYNTSLDKFEVYEDGAWVNMVGAGGSSQWTTAGSDIHYNTGNVGIGTTNPGSKLEVNGRIVSALGVNADALGAITADFTAANLIQASGASGACGTLNITNTAAGGSFTITIANATSLCTTVQWNGSAVNVKMPAGYIGGVGASGVIYTFLDDGAKLWVSYVPF